MTLSDEEKELGVELARFLRAARRRAPELWSQPATNVVVAHRRVKSPREESDRVEARATVRGPRASKARFRTCASLGTREQACGSCRAADKRARTVTADIGAVARV